MLLTPRLRKLALTAHIAVSVGWFGAAVAFLPLAVTGRTTQDPQTIRGAYLAMEVIGWYVLVPLAFASLLTGFVQSLGTRWGLVRHYWVLFKFLISVLSTVILLAYMQTLGFLAGLATEVTLTGAVPTVLRSYTAVLHASLALLALLVALALSVFKPRGMTPYGQRWQRGQPSVTADTHLDAADDWERSVPGRSNRRGTTGAPRWVKVFGIVVVVLVLLVGILLLVGGDDHRPRRHAHPAGHVPPAGHTSPADGAGRQP